MFTAVLALSTVSGRTNGLTFRMTFQKVTVKVGRSVTSLEEIYDLEVMSSNHRIRGQSHKASTAVIYESRFVNISNLNGIMTLES